MIAEVSMEWLITITIGIGCWGVWQAREKIREARIPIRNEEEPTRDVKRGR